MIRSPESLVIVTVKTMSQNMDNDENVTNEMKRNYLLLSLSKIPAALYKQDQYENNIIAGIGLIIVECSMIIAIAR